MAQNAISLGIRFDPDWQDVIVGIFETICSACNRGVITTARRDELLSDPARLPGLIA